MKHAHSFWPLVAMGLVMLLRSDTPTSAQVETAESPPAPQKADQASSAETVFQFVRAAAQGDKEAVEEALAKGVDINAETDSGLTAWHAAKRRGYLSLADHLVTRGADTSIPMPKPGDFAEALLARDRPQGAPALVVLVARDGEPLWERAFGLADLENDASATTDTKFLIGSVTKQFTAAAILKLQEEGKLAVTDSLQKFFPDFPRGDEVTLHHLLTHTSGIHSYTNRQDFGFRVTMPVDVEKLIEEIKTYDFDFDPGEKHLYSNSGYMLLGRIVELASGESYADYLKEQFFDPLGMNDTGIFQNGSEYENQAQGYSYVEEKFKPAKPWNMDWAGGAGQIYSTTHDLMRWNEGVFGGKVLGPESLKAAFSPATLNDGSTSQYGYGWAISETRGLKTISHNGGLDGFASHLARYPAENVTIVSFANCVPEGPCIGAFGAGPVLAEIFLWESMQPRPEHQVDTTVDVKSLTKYVGRYDYGGAIMAVTLEGDQLYAQLSGQQAFKIFPKSRTEFFLKVVDASIEFVLNDDGEVDHVIHRQAGNELKAPRISVSQFINLNTEQLDKFAGKYSYGRPGTLTIERQGTKLMAQLTGQPALEIRPLSPTAFGWVDVNARIEFELDDDGNITGATHYQAGQQLRVSVMD